LHGSGTPNLIKIGVPDSCFLQLISSALILLFNHQFSPVLSIFGFNFMNKLYPVTEVFQKRLKTK